MLGSYIAARDNRERNSITSAFQEGGTANAWTNYHSKVSPDQTCGLQLGPQGLSDMHNGRQIPLGASIQANLSVSYLERRRYAIMITLFTNDRSITAPK
jgi:hypothetical protein